MKKKFLLFFSVLIFSSAIAQDDCQLVYSTASYALNHAKKALKANNYEHQKYYSGKALDSYEKLEKLLKGSECEELSEKVQDIIADAIKAADPADWDRGRYYSKKVFTSTQDLISQMDSRTEVAVIEITP